MSIQPMVWRVVISYWGTRRGGKAGSERTRLQQSSFSGGYPDDPVWRKRHTGLLRQIVQCQSAMGNVMWVNV